MPREVSPVAGGARPFVTSASSAPRVALVAAEAPVRWDSLAAVLKQPALRAFRFIHPALRRAGRPNARSQRVTLATSTSSEPAVTGRLDHPEVVVIPAGGREGGPPWVAWASP